MNKEAVKNIAKWLWILAILAFTVFYVVKKRVLIGEMLGALSVWVLLIAGVFIFLAKICLVQNMCCAARQFSIYMSFSDCFRIYNLTQMGKYIPGSIWQFVGRISVLHELGIGTKAIRDSILAEQLWVGGSALILTLFLLLFSGSEFVSGFLSSYQLLANLNWLFVLIVLLLLVVLVVVKNDRFLSWVTQLSPPLMVLPALLLTWFFLGSSLWVTLLPFVTLTPSFLYIVGIYCLAYISGFVVPFAPAGFGVREAILVFALSPYVSPSEAILLAAVNRLIYFAVEVLLSGISVKINLTDRVGFPSH